MKSRQWTVTILLCLLIFAGLALFKYSQIKAAIAFGNSFPEPSASVEAETVTAQLTTTYTSAIGEIIAPQSIALRNQLEGHIVAVNFKPGGVVKQGDVLLQLDIREELAQLSAAEAKANLARLDLRRVERLLKEKTISAERVDQARAEHHIAEANIRGIQAIIDKKTITAPFDAQVGLHQFEVGQYLPKNSLVTTLVGISQSYWVDFNLPPAASGVNIGDAVIVKLLDESNSELSGTIIAKDSIASSSSRNLRFRAALNSASYLPPNSMVKVSIAKDTRPLITIPRTAIQTDTMGTYVFVLLPDSEPDQYRAQRQAVSVGGVAGNSSIILSGVNAGDLIATQGAFKLRSGLLAFVKQREQSDSELIAP